MNTENLRLVESDPWFDKVTTFELVKAVHGGVVVGPEKKAYMREIWARGDFLLSLELDPPVLEFSIRLDNPEMSKIFPEQTVRHGVVLTDTRTLLNVMNECVAVVMDEVMKAAGRNKELD